MADINKDWADIRKTLHSIKDKYEGHEDGNLNNMGVVCDLLILCTYSPEELEPIYHTLADHIDDLLGGKN